VTEEIPIANEMGIPKATQTKKQPTSKSIRDLLRPSRYAFVNLLKKVNHHQYAPHWQREINGCHGNLERGGTMVQSDVGHNGTAVNQDSKESEDDDIGDDPDPFLNLYRHSADDQGDIHMAHVLLDERRCQKRTPNEEVAREFFRPEDGLFEKVAEHHLGKNNRRDKNP